jgi:hypothetical protein
MVMSGQPTGQPTGQTTGQSGEHRRRLRLGVAAVIFVALAVFMYVSIMYKIVNYGP